MKQGHIFFKHASWARNSTGAADSRRPDMMYWHIKYWWPYPWRVWLWLQTFLPICNGWLSYPPPPSPVFFINSNSWKSAALTVCGCINDINLSASEPMVKDLVWDSFHWLSSKLWHLDHKHSSQLRQRYYIRSCDNSSCYNRNLCSVILRYLSTSLWKSCRPYNWLVFI